LKGYISNYLVVIKEVYAKLMLADLKTICRASIGIYDRMTCGYSYGFVTIKHVYPAILCVFMYAYRKTICMFSELYLCV
jgi:hypothetical protein